jgi:hypothetical protein
MGLIPYVHNNPYYKEFICAQLAMPLTIGMPVQLSMKVALGGFGNIIPSSAKWTCKGVGMRLSTQPFEYSLNAPWPNSAQVFLDEVLTDTVNWILLSTEYVADSAYQFVTIGNFFEDSLSAPTILDSADVSFWAYVFVDEVCISMEPEGCYGSNAIGTAEAGYGWTAVSPFSERLEVMLAGASDQSLRLALVDMNGRLADTKVILAGQDRIDWDATDLCDGVYVLTPLGPNVGMDPIRVSKVSP